MLQTSNLTGQHFFCLSVLRLSYKMANCTMKFLRLTKDLSYNISTDDLMKVEQSCTLISQKGADII